MKETINFLTSLVQVAQAAKDSDLDTSAKVIENLNMLLVKHGFKQLPSLTDTVSWKFAKFPSTYNTKSIQVARHHTQHEGINFFVGIEDMEGAFAVISPDLSLTVSKPGKNGTVFGESLTWLYENVTEFIEQQQQEITT